MNKILFLVLTALGAGVLFAADAPLIASTESFEGESFPPSGDKLYWETEVVTLKQIEYSASDDAPATGMGDKYLSIRADGDEGKLTRNFTNMNDWQHTTEGVDTPNSVKMGKVYVDTYLRVPAIDYTPEIGEDAKLALWLDYNNGTPRLMVKCGTYLDYISGSTVVELDKSITENSWHQIRIETFCDAQAEYPFGFFTISIDGTRVGAKDKTIELIDAECLDALLPNTRERGYYDNREIFPTLAEYSSAEAGELIGAIFQGTADIDMLEIKTLTDSRTMYSLTFTGATSEQVVIWINDGRVAAEYAEGSVLTIVVRPRGNREFVSASAPWTKNTAGELYRTLPALADAVTVEIPVPTDRERQSRTVSIVAAEHTSCVGISVNGTASSAVASVAAKEGDEVVATFAPDEGYTLAGEESVTMVVAYGATSPTIYGPGVIASASEPVHGPSMASEPPPFSLTISMDGDKPVIGVVQNAVSGRQMKTALKVTIMGSTDLKNWHRYPEEEDPLNKDHFFKGIIEE